ncbi:MAG: nucleotide excision repair endonuclease [Luteolibacter sp.]
MTESSRTRQPELFRMENLLTRRLGADFFAALPELPGVYFHFDRDERLLYIGQSSNLKNRIGSYRHVTPGGHARRTVRLVARIHRIEWEICESAVAAVERERVLLLEYRPPFNRTGVWKGDPWWLEGRIHPGSLILSLNRDQRGLGPLPPSFRYALGGMSRCVFRAMMPGTPSHLYPLGLMQGVAARHLSLAVPDPEAAWNMLRDIMSGKIGSLMDLATAIPDPPISQWDAFWTEEIQRIIRYMDKPLFLVPSGQDGFVQKKPPALFQELPLGIE